MGYGSVTPCVLNFIREVNRATETYEEQTKHTGEGDICAICHDTVGAQADGEKALLYMIALPRCGHRFHELCLLNWLSPIALPPTTDESLTPDGPFLQPIVRSTVDGPSSLGVGETVESIMAAYGYNQREVSDEEAQAELTSRAGTTLREELEEGEISQLDISDQVLPPFNFFNGTFRPMAILHTSGPIATSHSCPLCRQPAFRHDPYCHGDNLVILRARIRLANLARECCGWNRHMEVDGTDSLAEFLQRRSQDNLALGEREIPLDPTEAKGCFLIARLMLIEDAYARLLHLNTRESIMSCQSNLMLLISFFTHFVLRPHHRNYFFDPNARDLSEWDLQILEDEPLLLYERPQIFCRELRLKTEEDSDIRANPARIKMAISALLDDSHDHDVEMEEASTTDVAPELDSPFNTSPR
ncbi:MAG: hypothetical protein Q9202_002912 [Teloschistes flavicans]